MSSTPHILIDADAHLRITLMRGDGMRQTIAVTGHEGSITVYSEGPAFQETPQIVLVTERVAKLRGSYKPE